jgi:hypothetical protein
MRLWKRLAILGIIVLVIGIFVASFSSISTQQYIPVTVSRGTHENPAVSANFSAGQLFDLYISPGATWAEDPLLDEGYPTRYVWVNVTDPTGKLVRIEYAFGRFDSQFAIYVINQLDDNGSTLRSFEPSSFRIRGNVTGTYTALLWQILPPPHDWFSAFDMRRLDLDIEYPNASLLPVGAVILVCGIIIMMLAWLDPWKKQKERNPTRRKSASR